MSYMYKSFKHLYLSEDSREAIYLGYRINLTKTEYAILCVLIENNKRPVSANDFCKLSGIELSKQNLAYHVFRINSKAKAIGNRVLIKNMAKIGYFLNLKM